MAAVANNMSNLFHIAAGGFDLFIWLIIIAATIIAQIVKAGRKVGGSVSPDTPRPRSVGPAPQDELRDFLQTLSRTEQPPQAIARPAAPPPPPPARARPVAMPIHAPRPEPRAMPLTPRRPARHTAAKPARTAPQRVPGSRSIQVARELGQKESLRKAILLREILGPPLALRESPKNV